MSPGAEKSALEEQQKLFKEQQKLIKELLEDSRKRDEDSRKRDEDAKNREERLLKLLEQRSGAASSGGALLASMLGDRITIFEYDAEGGVTFTKWFQRFEDIVTAEGGGLSEAEQARLLISKLNDRAYARLSNVVAPKRIKDLPIKELSQELEKLFGEKSTIFRRRYNALRTTRQPGESYREYASSVNRMCEAALLKDMKEQDFKTLLFVGGLQQPEDSELRKRLLRKLEVTETCQLEDLLVECDSMQTLIKDAARIGGDEQVSEVNKVMNQRRRNWKSNPSKEAIPEKPMVRGACYNCGEIGHYASNCQRKVGRGRPAQPPTQRKWRDGKRGGPAYAKKIEEDESIVIAATRKMVEVNIGSQRVEMQLDTGADVTLIDRATWRSLGSPTLESVDTKLKAANGTPIAVMGRLRTDFACKEFSGHGSCYVTEDIKLLGIDWIDQLPPFKETFDTMCCTVKTTELTEGLRLEFPDVFKKELGRCSKMKARFVLKKDAQPIFAAKRKIPFAVEPLVMKEIDRLVEQGVVSPVEYSRWAAPIVAVKKKTGAVRVCSDFSTGLNDALELHRHPLPTAEEIFAQLNGGKYFTQIDFADAYLQIEVEESSKELVTITTQKGLFRYNRLPFGVKSAPGIFQQVMDSMIAGLEGCAAYLDDVIVTGGSLEEHNRNVRNLFERINDYGFRVRLEKCSFAQRQIRFLGHVIDKDGRRPDPEKIAAIKNMPEPKNLQQVESFLGLVSYYSSFVSDMRSFRAPLDALKKKDTEFVWSKDCKEAFEKLKEVLQSDLLLTHYDPKMEIVVAADASDYGIGAVISHRYPNGMEKAIWHCSRALTPAEKNYGQIEKEALALVYAVRKFHRYIYGRPFMLLTDHKPLLAVFGSRKGISVHSTNRLQRWSLVLLAYDFKIQYRSTTSFGQADALSRLIATQHVPEEDIVIGMIEDDVAAVYLDAIRTLPVMQKDIRAAMEKDHVLPNIVESVKTGRWCQGKPGSALHNFHSRRMELSIFEGCLFLGRRIVVPHSLQGRVLRMLHDGHPGATRMKMLARNNVYWQGMDKDIENLVKSCVPCQSAAKMPLKNELKPWPDCTRAMERIHIDFAGPMEGRMYLVVVDAYSKWPEIREMTMTSATATIKEVGKIFAQFGFPEVLVSDNGSQFTSKEFEEYCRRSGIKHVKTPPFHPQSNGQAERFVDTFKRTLKKLKGEGTTAEMLQKFLMTYRSTPCTSSPGKRSPAENFIGRPLRTPLTTLSRTSRRSVKEENHLPEERRTKMEEQFNRHHGARNKELTEDALVYARDYKNPAKPTWIPARVLRKIGRTIYEVITTDGRTWKRHMNQLRKRYNEDVLPTMWEDFDLKQEDTQPADGSTSTAIDVTGDISTGWDDSDSDSDTDAGTTYRRPTRNCGPPKKLVMDPSNKKYSFN